MRFDRLLNRPEELPYDPIDIATDLDLTVAQMAPSADPTLSPSPDANAELDGVTETAAQAAQIVSILRDLESRDAPISSEIYLSLLGSSCELNDLQAISAYESYYLDGAGDPAVLLIEDARAIADDLTDTAATAPLTRAANPLDDTSLQLRIIRYQAERAKASVSALGTCLSVPDIPFSTGSLMDLVGYDDPVGFLSGDISEIRSSRDSLVRLRAALRLADDLLSVDIRRTMTVTRGQLFSRALRAIARTRQRAVFAAYAATIGPLVREMVSWATRTSGTESAFPVLKRIRLTAVRVLYKKMANVKAQFVDAARMDRKFYAEKSTKAAQITQKREIRVARRVIERAIAFLDPIIASPDRTRETVRQTLRCISTEADHEIFDL